MIIHDFWTNVVEETTHTGARQKTNDGKIYTVTNKRYLPLNTIAEEAPITAKNGE